MSGAMLFAVPPLCSGVFADLPCNRLASALEVSDTCSDPPEHIFAYPSADYSRVTTWMGDTLGHVSYLGHWYVSNMKDERCGVRFYIGNAEYTGTIFGTYIRARRVRGQS